jgi:CubicO group peptidase (beta-lactamase class C family)
MSMSCQGLVKPGFEKVRDAFMRNLETHDQAGASVCVYRHGRPVVDLWGGVNPLTARPCTDETVTVIFSATKGATALCAHILAERGLLDIDAPVVRYWPEFAAAGKRDMPVRYLLSHRSGLPAPDAAARLTIRDYTDWDRMTAALAAQRPWWPPGKAVFYHSITFGFLVGEVVRRISGKSPGQFFRDEVAEPLGLDFWIGMPASEDAHYAPSVLPQLASDAYWAGVPEGHAGPPGAASATTPDDVRAALGLDPASTAAQTPYLRAQLLMPAEAGKRGTEFFNAREFRAAEIPASSGVTNARGLARMYAACIGEVEGVRLLRPETVAALRECQTDGIPAPAPDVVISRGAPPRIGLGLQVSTPPTNVMLGEGSFGHSGAGGRLGFAHPELGIAFGYVPAQLWPEHSSADPRWTLLIGALKQCL